MHSITPSEVIKLRQLLAGTDAAVLTEGEPGYAEGIRRWSDTCGKKAVSDPWGRNTLMRLC